MPHAHGEAAEAGGGRRARQSRTIRASSCSKPSRRRRRTTRTARARSTRRRSRRTRATPRRSPASATCAHALARPAGRDGYYKRALAVNPVYLPALVGLADVRVGVGRPRRGAEDVPRHHRSLPGRDVPGAREAARERSPRRHRRAHARTDRRVRRRERSDAERRSDAREAPRAPHRRGARALALLGAAACDGRPKTDGGGDRDGATPRGAGPAVAVIDLRGRRARGSRRRVPRRCRTRKRELRSLRARRRRDRRRQDKDVKGVLVRFGGASHRPRARRGARRPARRRPRRTQARLLPRRRLLERDAAAPRRAAARRSTCRRRAASRRSGSRRRSIYLHKLLADELHISIDFLQVGKFKGRRGAVHARRAERRGARVARRACSPTCAPRGSTASQNGRGKTASTRRRGRGRAVLAGRGEGARAHRRGRLPRRRASTRAKKATGAVRDEARFGARRRADKTDDLGDVVRAARRRARRRRAPVALVRAIGEHLDERRRRGLLGGQRRDHRARAGAACSRASRRTTTSRRSCLRIDSPGGSALASDLIWHAADEACARRSRSS